MRSPNLAPMSRPHGQGPLDRAPCVIVRLVGERVLDGLSAGAGVAALGLSGGHLNHRQFTLTNGSVAPSSFCPPSMGVSLPPCGGGYEYPLRWGVPRCLLMIVFERYMRRLSPPFSGT